ncbi:MAG: hypothetical protein AB1726_03555, partial [Planctomycetota bacterium]
MDEPLHRLDRRQCLQAAAGAVGGLGLLAAGAPAAARARRSEPATLVLVQLTGGNDGLSTVVPGGDDAYHRARPALRLAPREVLPLDPGRGLHPALRGLRAHWDAGELAIVEGVGHPAPERTHFASLGFWHAADARGRAAGEGWVGRLLAAAGEEADPGRPVHVGSRPPFALAARRSSPTLLAPGATRAADPALAAALAR